MAPELAAHTVAPYLIGRGLLPPGAASVEKLGGGVSSRVFLVSSNRRRLIVKQPLPRFRVRDEWLVDTDRIGVEANFLRHIGSRLPSGSLPEFVSYDEPEQVLVVTAAAPNFRPWKAALLSGDADPRLAHAAGQLLAKIHRIGSEEPSLRATFDQSRLFDQQRIDPYLGTLLMRHPTRADALRKVIAHLETDRTTLIHGDFSPKNILTDKRALLLVDHEVATWNDPVFDVSFFLNHLLLKFAHTKASEAIAECVHSFLGAYASAAPTVARERLQQPSHLLPSLMLARVDGKSPVE
ncbi:MAG TPA: aminoglycoside phosphotransferase family protein, partial [Candidatus Thermoplasmatota archaeon]